MPLPTPEELSSLRRERDGAMAAFISANLRVQDLKTALQNAERTADGQSTGALNEIQRQVAQATEDANAARDSHADLGKRAFAGLGRWLEQTPGDLVERLPDRDPFLLFPVRLETKFARTSAGSPELRVRIWPDEIGIALPPGDLSKEETAAGRQYWEARAIVAMTPTGTPQAEAARKTYEAAWATVARLSGSYRAGWVVRQTKPDWDDVKNAPKTLPLHFSEAVPSVTPRIARAEVLPDRFVIVGSFGTQTFPEVVGAPIPDDLALAPDPAQGKPMVERDAKGTLVVADALRWMVDFDIAVSVGMGIRIPLTPPWDTTGFELLMAIGVRGATSSADGVKHVEDLLSKHRFDTGCGIVRSGTPTNNTDSAISGWQPPSTEEEELFAVEDQPAPLGPVPLGETDGHRLVKLLGLSEAFVSRLPNAGATDIAEALAMNRAASFGTMFEFVRELLSPLVDPRTRQELRAFFHQNVSGRGILPALRVGRQPYGIVVTSDWPNWKFPVRPQSPLTIEQKLHALLQTHRPKFEQLVSRPQPPGTAGVAPFAHLLHIVGQLASSVQYLSRTASTLDFLVQQLRMEGGSDTEIANLKKESILQHAANLGRILPGINSTQAHLVAVVFTKETNPWLGPIIDEDPKVPLSEHAPIANFDGARNYLTWLAQANLTGLKSEHFIGPAGTAIPPPTALLYVLLRYALLTAVEEGTLEVASIAGAKIFDVVERDPLIANIGQSQHVLKSDYMTVDAASLGLASASTPLASWVHETARAVPARSQLASALAVVTDANQSIGALATVPTARLERLLAEHIDLCSYRVDAWVTGFYSQRLEAMRDTQQRPGLYIGCYGWVENLKPDWTSRTAVPVDALPQSLRDKAKGPVFQSKDNGGFVHAPSLPQAVTAAVLRNAYLSHATPEERDLFGVNLSSSRVRVAQTYIEGIRNGQGLAALLGYEFERGLHERHPGIELDQYRYVLRDLFPYMAGKLTDFQVGVNAEVVEARNVINGLDLLEFTAGKNFPFGLEGLPAAGTPAGNAIDAEVGRMRDGLDAVSDLLLAESVHQAVGGNMERTKASLQALTDPEAAPDPEIIRTPRSARLLKFRVALALDAASKDQWPGPVTPRAAANPALNSWLVQHLPVPSAIQWSVKNGAAATQMEALSGLQLQPIDLVLLTGDQLGKLSSELERLIVRRFRDVNGVGDDVKTHAAPLSGPPDDVPPLVFDFEASGAANQSLGKLHPLLTRLRRLISRSRAMHALDWLPTGEIKSAEPMDPSGSASGDAELINLKDLNDRLTDGINGLKAVQGGLQSALNNLVPLQPQIDDLVKALFEAHAYGIPEALPADGKTISETQVATLGAQAQVVLNLIAKRLAAVKTLLTSNLDPLPTTNPELSLETARRIRVALEKATDAARELFGTAFVIVPLFHFHQPAQTTELNLAAAGPVIADDFAIEEWLHSIARVRPAVADVTWAMAVSAWVGKPILDPKVIQLPRLAGLPWIGGEFGVPLPEGDYLAVVALSSAAGFSGLQCGLVLDEWTENVPSDQSTTGVSFHFNRPNATAPQALLLAVPPVIRGNWQWEELKGCVREALNLAKLRSLEPDALVTGGYFQGLPAILHEFNNTGLARTNFNLRSAIAAQVVK